MVAFVDEVVAQTFTSNSGWALSLNSLPSCLEEEVFKYVTTDRVYKHCIHINAPHMCTHCPNHEVCADKLPGRLF